jgi:hypothetical protein
MEDAIAGGFNLASIDRLRNRYNESTFNMLYMCVFVDSKDSVFRFSDLQACGVETDTWQDHNPDAPRRLVIARYGVDLTRRAAAICPVSSLLRRPCSRGKIPRAAGVQLEGMNFRYQAKQIEELFRRYNFTYIGVDVTGIGQGFLTTSSISPCVWLSRFAMT